MNARTLHSVRNDHAARTLRTFKTELLHAIARALYWKPFVSTKWMRRPFFDCARPNIRLASMSGEERFLVASSGLASGRSVPTRGDFDFERLRLSLAMLGESFSPRLLVDVGANIGTICIPAVRRGLFENAVAFEPEPFSYSLLSANLGLNAVADRVRTYGLARSGAESRGFDEVVSEIDPSDTLIRIDARSFRSFVLQGAGRVLAKRPPLVIEFWPRGITRSGSYPMLKRLVRESGYGRIIDLGSDAHPVEASEAALDALYVRLGDAGGRTDLLLI